MIAAVYARKSTEQTGVADDQKSVARQIEHARAYAARRGWVVAEQHVYIDDGISGAEFATRPGFLRLMNALKPRAPFQALVMSEESRLGRESIEVSYALKQLVQAGVRVFLYLEDRERTLDSPIDKVMLSLSTFADELEREKARQRTYDAMLRKARAGHVTGGRTFGYENLRMDTGGVRRVINDDEAAVVRRIFELVAAGRGLSAVAKLLNAERALSPRAQRGRPNGWAPSSVREVLYRSIYRGEITWNQSRKRDRWGVKNQQPRAEQEWIRVQAPDLAIVSPALWETAHAQMAQQRARYNRTSPRAGAPWSNEGKYLLTGLLRCGMCGGGLEARSRQHGSRRVLFYGCAACHRRGRSVCANNLIVPMEIADNAVIAALESDLLDPRVLKAAVDRAVKHFSGRRRGTRTAALRRDLVAVEKELSNLTAAVVAGGGDVSVVVAALRAREAQRAALQSQIEQSLHSVPFDAKAATEELHERLADCRALLHDHTSKARRLLKQLIVGRLNMQPDAERGFYRFKGIGSLAPLLSGAMPVLPQNMASPAGFEPAFWP